MSEDTEHHGLVSIHACGQDAEANVVIAFLKENGIKARIDSDLPHSIYPVSSDCEVYVHEDDAVAARKIIEEQLKLNEDASDK